MRVAVVPARNEQAYLPRLLNALIHRVDVVLVVDDASEDATGEVAATFGCVVLRNASQAGYGLTLRRGLLWCSENGASVVATVDADGLKWAAISHLPILVIDGALSAIALVQWMVGRRSNSHWREVRWL